MMIKAELDIGTMLDYTTTSVKEAVYKERLATENRTVQNIVKWLRKRGHTEAATELLIDWQAEKKARKAAPQATGSQSGMNKFEPNAGFSPSGGPK